MCLIVLEMNTTCRQDKPIIFNFIVILPYFLDIKINKAFTVLKLRPIFIGVLIKYLNVIGRCLHANQPTEGHNINVEKSF